MRRAGARLAIVLTVILSLGGCAPTHRWVGPAGLDAPGADLADCRHEAALRTDREMWFERQRLQRDAWWARSPSERAFANARLHQMETLSSLNRQRAFEGCMGARGWRLQEISP